MRDFGIECAFVITMVFSNNTGSVIDWIDNLLR